MTTTIPQLRMALRKGNCVKNTPNTNRDPLYAQKQSNNYAQMPSTVELRISNTSTAPIAAKRILRGASRPTESDNNHPHQDQPTSMPQTMPRFGYSYGYTYGYGYGYGYDYDQTMQEKKGCRTNTAPMGTNHTTSVDTCNDQDPDPMAEGIGLGATSRIDEDGGLQEHHDKPKRHERPTRPKRHETRPPRIPEHDQLTTSTTPALEAPGQRVARTANETTRLLGQPFYLISKKVREGETKKSEKSKRPERSESPNNLGASVPPNLSEPRSTAVFQSPRLPIKDNQPCQCLHGELDGNQVDIENVAEKKGPGEKRMRKHKILGNYLQMNRMGP